MAEAMQGTQRAQEAARMFGEMSGTSEERVRWAERFMPSGGFTTRPEDFGEWMEDWWRAMGVVPRYRYLELLDRYETLRTRLQDMEDTMQGFRLKGAGTEQAKNAQDFLDLWEPLIQETLKAQSEWLRTWKPNEPKAGQST